MNSVREWYSQTLSFLIQKQLPGSFVTTSDFEAGLRSIQIVSECCSRCGACYESQKAAKQRETMGKSGVNRSEALKFYAGAQGIHRPDRQKQN